MSDSSGASAFAYSDFGAFRGELASEDGPWANDTVRYGYESRNRWEDQMTKEDEPTPEQMLAKDWSSESTWPFTNSFQAFIASDRPGPVTTHTNPDE